MEHHERPGVYSDYDLSSVLIGGTGRKTVALAAKYSGSGVTEITSFRQAKSVLSEESTETVLCLIRLLLQNGAGCVLMAPVAETTANDYKTAAELLLAEKKACFLVCDSETAEIQGAISEAISAAAMEGNACIGVAGISGSTVSALTAQAAYLNSERMVLVSGNAALSWDSETSGGIYGAAAFSGFLAGEADPALPKHGAVLSGISSVSERFTETEIDALVNGGVTQLEGSRGEVSAIRAVTTRTTTNGVQDQSLREITTMLIVDDVIPGIRNVLRTQFRRRKNTTATRGAIRTAVMVELENKVKQEIIDSYGDITVAVNDEDPTVVDVGFAFAVTHGLSIIYLTAHITV